MYLLLLHALSFTFTARMISSCRLTDDLREMILARAPTSEIKQAMRAKGMRFLRDAAVEKLLSGVTTLREINKVTFVE